MDKLLEGNWMTAGFADRNPLEEKKAAGFSPCGTVILIAPDPVPTSTTGGIALPDDIIARNELGQIFGYVVAVGPNAWFDEPSPRCAVGDRVMFAKFVGQLFTGPDGRRYRAINDKDIVGVIHQEVKA